MLTSLNVLYDQPVLQLVYNVIHWLLGLNLILFAYFEYRAYQKKSAGRKTSLRGPVIFLSNGLFFILYVFIAHLIYLRHYDLPWQFEHEQYFHLGTGIAFFLGGLIELLHRRAMLKNKFWKLGLPLCLAVGGLLFLHPQHGVGNVLVYMTRYHIVLALVHTVAAITLVIAEFMHSKKLQLLALGLVALAGLVFLSYRHQYNAEAQCRQQGTVHTLELDANQKKPSKLSVSLCDNVRVVSADGNDYHINFDTHSNHSEHTGHQAVPGHVMVMAQDEADSQPTEFIVQLSGVFTFQDHHYPNVRGSISIERPTNLKKWLVIKR